MFFLLIYMSVVMCVQATLVAEALRAAAPTIEQDVNNLAAEIVGRLLPYYATFPNIRALIRSCDLDSTKHCTLLPTFPYLDVGGYATVKSHLSVVSGHLGD
jgi:hypothetical protein